jgi:hypothetical protein
MVKLSCIGYCAQHAKECEHSEGVDRDAVTHCNAEECPQEADNG